MTRKRQERKRKLAFLFQEMENLGEKRELFLKRRMGKRVRFLSKGSPSLSRIERGVKRLFRRIFSPPQRQIFLFGRDFQFKRGKKSFLGRKKYCQIFLAPATQIKGETTRLESLRKRSLFKSQLVEKRRISLLYPKFFGKKMYSFFIKWKGRKRIKNSFGETLFSFQEGRADVLLFRVHFFPSVLCSRQWIRHGRISLNGEKLPFPEYILSPGDILAILPPFHRFFSPYPVKKSNISNQSTPFSSTKQVHPKGAASEGCNKYNEYTGRDRCDICHKTYYSHQRDKTGERKNIYSESIWGGDVFLKTSLFHDTPFSFSHLSPVPQRQVILKMLPIDNISSKIRKSKKKKDLLYPRVVFEEGKLESCTRLKNGAPFTYSEKLKEWSKTRRYVMGEKGEKWKKYYFQKNHSWDNNIMPKGEKFIFYRIAPLLVQENIPNIYVFWKKWTRKIENDALSVIKTGKTKYLEMEKVNFEKTFSNSQPFKTSLLFKKLLFLPLFFCRKMKRFQKKEFLDKLRHELSFYLQFCGRRVWSISTQKAQSRIIYNKWLKEIKFALPMKSLRDVLPSATFGRNFQSHLSSTFPYSGKNDLQSKLRSTGNVTRKKSTLPQIKPAHVEVSYASLRVIFLFNPQRVPFPTLVDLGILERSFHPKG